MSEVKNQNSPDINRDIWEYKILNLSVDNKQNTSHPDPEKDSQKLKGSLSANFIRQQFPEQYSEKKELHPADQLQNILNLLGNEGWELKCSEKVGRFLFFFFMRKKHL